MEPCTVDSIANAKVFILVRPMSAFVEIRVLRREFLGDSKSNVRFENHSGSNLQSCIIHDCDVNSWPSKNSLARIEPRTSGSKTNALTIITCLIIIITIIIRGGLLKRKMCYFCKV